MDIRMPGMDGIEATRRIVGPMREGGVAPEGSGSPVPRVLVLTTFDLDEYVYAALRAGASGFLLKDATAERIVDAVRVVAAGDALLAPSVTRRLVAEFAVRAPGGLPPTVDGLTPREVEVFTVVGRGLSNAEIAARLVVSEQTVKTHVSRVLGKLGLRDGVQAVVLAEAEPPTRAGPPGACRHPGSPQESPPALPVVPAVTSWSRYRSMARDGAVQSTSPRRDSWYSALVAIDGPSTQKWRRAAGRVSEIPNPSVPSEAKSVGTHGRIWSGTARM